MPVEIFRGEFPSLASLMQASWSENKQPALLFTEEFLRSAFDYPGSSFDLTSAVYKDSGIAGFCAAFPRNVRMGERQVPLAVNSFLTVASRFKGAGHGVALWGDTAKKARKAGFEGTINFCVDGDDMHRMMPAVGKFFGLNSRPVYRVEYLSRFLRPAHGESPETPEPDTQMFLDLTGKRARSAPLIRIWRRDEALWQCRDRSGAVAVSMEQEGRRGMLTGYVMMAQGNPPVRVALMEDLLWGDLNEAEQSQLVQRFLAAAAARGAQSASCPVMGYSPVAPLTAAGFRPSKRVLHTWLTLWTGMEPESFSSLYTDVF